MWSWCSGGFVAFAGICRGGCSRSTGILGKVKHSVPKGSEFGGDAVSVSEDLSDGFVCMAW